MRLPVERLLVPGEAAGRLLALERPLSLWGGFDPESGRIVDPRHPQCGAEVKGRLLVLPAGRGSSSSSSVLLEAVRLETAPAALLTLEADPILALGALVAQELYGRWPAVAVLAPRTYARLETGRHVRLTADGRLELHADEHRETR